MLQGKDTIDVQNSKELKIIELSNSTTRYQIPRGLDLRVKSIPPNVHLFRIVEKAYAIASGRINILYVTGLVATPMASRDRNAA